jgi:gamma-glutamyl-gamma-aminobutyrate hydrolase PuuD
VAFAQDGTIEALEDAGGRVIGVQWHPELLADRPEQRCLFSWLVEQADARSRHLVRDASG